MSTRCCSSKKSAIAYPQDPVIASRLGFALYAVGSTSNDKELRQKIWERAQTIMLQSQANGDNSSLTLVTLESLSKGDPTAVSRFSDTKAAESEIRKGEEAFVRGDLKKALVAYQRALELDPRLYEAALYAGDMEFRLAHASRDSGFRKEHFAQAPESGLRKLSKSIRTARQPIVTGATLWTKMGKLKKRAIDLSTQ